MTISQIYDRLLAQPVRTIEWCDGSAPLRAGDRPIVISDIADDEVLADAWVEPTRDGLVLHFNARNQPGGGQHGQEEPLANILRVE